MTGFNNPIIGGGGALAYPSIHSPDFATGSAGWTVRKDGSAEFNDVVIRNGTVVSGKALYYSGPPALGNLIASVAAAAGTDAQGNAYLAGEVTYGPAIGGGLIAIQASAGILAWWTAAAAGGPWTQRVTAVSDAAGNLILTTAGPHLDLQAGSALVLSLTAALATFSTGVDINTGGLSVTGGLATDTADIVANRAGGLLLDIQDNTAAPTGAIVRVRGLAAADAALSLGVTGDTSRRFQADTNGKLQWGSGLAAPDVNLYRGAAGQLKTDSALNSTGGTAAAPTLITTDTPQAFSFVNSWTQAAGRKASAYKLMPDGELEVAGSVVVPAGVAAGQPIIAAAAAAYRPQVGQSLLAFNLTGNVAIRLTWTSGGVLQFSGPIGSVAAGNTLDIPAQRVNLADP